MIDKYLILISISIPIIFILLMFKNDVKFYRDLYHKESKINNDLVAKIIAIMENQRRMQQDGLKAMRKYYKSRYKKRKRKD